MKKLFYLLLFIGIFVLFTYKLTRIPPGINFDESSIGYNAALISKNLRDETGRFLPVFILTLNQKDWKRPVNIYTTALLFRLFGVSYFNLKLTSVIWAMMSCLLFYKLLRLFFPEALSLAGLLLFISSPSMLIQSHLALENIALLPFLLGWLYFLISYSLRQNRTYLLLSGISLGISFYSYKGMSSMVPVYLFVSSVFLLHLYLKKKVTVKNASLFFLGLSPFLLPIPWLIVHYAGAIYDPLTVSFRSYYDMLIVYLSSFDFSFLFGKGDSMLVHSTGRHGMFLAPTLILFFLGLSAIYREKKAEYYLIFFSLLLTPLLLTLVNSIYRASRLMAYIPLATFIFVLGLKVVCDYPKKIIRIMVLVIFAAGLCWSYFDFTNYYYGDYPKRIVADFAPNLEGAFSELANLSRSMNKTPYIESDDYNHYRFDINFFEQVYFPKGNLNIWIREVDAFPDNGLLLTGIDGGENLTTLKKIENIESGQRNFYILDHK